jgi:hypothetical protein
MTRFLSSPTCNIYKKIYQSIPDSPYARLIADSMCKQARKYKIDPSLPVEDLVNAIRIKNGDFKNADAVPDKTYPSSHYQTVDECRQDLIQNQGLAPDVAAAQCARQLPEGKSEGIVSGKSGKAILDRIMKQIPNISPNSAKIIVDEAIRESQVRANIQKSRKAVSELQANSRNVYAASLSRGEIPPYTYIDLVRNGKLDPLDTSATSHIKSGSDEQGAKNWLTIQMHYGGKKFEDTSSSKIKSASVKDNAWLFTDRKLVNRNAFEYQRQEAEKKSNIRNASTTTDNRPSWLQIMDYHAKGSPN